MKVPINTSLTKQVHISTAQCRTKTNIVKQHLMTKSTAQNTRLMTKNKWWQTTYVDDIASMTKVRTTKTKVWKDNKDKEHCHQIWKDNTGDKDTLTEEWRRKSPECKGKMDYDKEQHWQRSKKGKYWQQRAPTDQKGKNHWQIRKDHSKG